MTDGWGWPKTNALPTDGAERATRRAEDRARRMAERIAAAEERSAARAATRDAAAQVREDARDARRAAEIERSATRPPSEEHETYAKRRRSGSLARTGTEVKRERDTRGYAMVVDTARIRALAGKGTSLSGLAAAFGITTEEVEAALREG